MGLGYRHWTMEDFPWDKFDLSKVDEDQVRIVRAAAQQILTESLSIEFRSVILTNLL